MTPRRHDSSPERLPPERPSAESGERGDEVGSTASVPAMPPRVGRKEPYDTGETLPLETRQRGALEAPPRLSGEQQRRNRRRRAFAAVAIGVAAVVAIAVVAFGFVWLRGLENSLRFAAADREPIERAVTSVHSGVETYTVLALGVDGDPAQQTQPLRAVMLLRITPDKVSAISLAPDIAVRPQVPRSPTDAGPGTVPPVARAARRGDPRWLSRSGRHRREGTRRTGQPRAGGAHLVAQRRS